MPDDQIVEYLRSRANVTLPPDLIGSVVNAVEATPHHRHSWFTPFIPAAAALGVVGTVLVAALLVGQGSRFGPGPTGGPSADPTPAVTPAVSPAVTPAASDMPDPEGLLEPGDTRTLDAVDATGTWGTITIERGEDVAGYPQAEIDPEFFLVELFIGYDAARSPDTEQFGSPDWALRPVDDDAEYYFNIEPLDLGDDGIGPQPALGVYPGAIDIFSTPTEGWIVFAVPRREANLDLEVVYVRAGSENPDAATLVRIAGEPPDPLPGPSTERDEGYVDREGLPFSVLDSPEADELFETPDTCTNPESGYTLTFPDDWYTNTAVGDTPACTWFSPVYYEVSDPDAVPAEVAITVDAFEGDVGFLWVDLYSQDIDLDGVAGRRFEHGYTKEADMATDQYQYNYLFRLDESSGAKIWAITDTNRQGDYALNKAVLDRIMASLQFTDGE